jgi:hypothetical protein
MLAGEAELGALQASVEELLSLQRRLARTRTIWAEQRALLQEQERLLQSRRDQLAKQLQQRDASGGVTLSEEARAEAKRQRAALLAAADQVAAAETALHAWAEALPEPFQRPAREALKGLPPAGTPLPIAELPARCRVVLDAYGALQQLARSVTLERLLLIPPRQTDPQQFDVLLLGFSAAYAVSADREAAAVGRRSPEGWTWRWKPDLATEIDQAVATARGTGSVALRRLPIRVRDTAK